MTDLLVHRLASAMLRFKRTDFKLPVNIDIHLGELIVLIKISASADGEDGCSYFQEIQHELGITQPAVSQMIKALEKKDYVRREIDPIDKRKFVITPTEKGRIIMEDVREKSHVIFSEIIKRFGDDKIVQFLDLFDEFSALINELNSER